MWQYSLFLFSGCSSLKDLLVQIIYHTTFDSTEDISYVAQCLEILQRNMNFSGVELEEYLTSLLSEEKKVTEDIRGAFVQKEEYDPFAALSTEIPVMEIVKPQDMNMATPRYESGNSVNTRREDGQNSIRSSRLTESLSNIGSSDTLLLGASEPSYIKQIRTGKIYYLQDIETKIGKRQCQITITDNPAVSKEHALFQKIDGEYYLVDLKSTNGTKVNDQKLMANTPMRMEDEMQFELANEKFIFYK